MLLQHNNARPTFSARGIVVGVARAQHIMARKIRRMAAEQNAVARLARPEAQRPEESFIHAHIIADTRLLQQIRLRKRIRQFVIDVIFTVFATILWQSIQVWPESAPVGALSGLSSCSGANEQLLHIGTQGLSGAELSPEANIAIGANQ